MTRVVCLLVCGLLCVVPADLHGGAMAPPPPFFLGLAGADAVLVGKATAFEEKTVKAERRPGDREKGEYRVALVKIEEPLIGARGLTHLRVGLLPPTTFRGSGGLPRVIPSANLVVGQQALMLLCRHPTENFWVMPNDWDVVDAKAGDYRLKADLARRAGKLLADPPAGLKAKDRGDRLLTASLLVGRYRTNRPGHRLEQIPVAESKGILEALAEADWTQVDRLSSLVGPQLVFFYLGLTEADGWRAPSDFRETSAAARKWLRENAGKYRLTGFVPARIEKGRSE